MKTGQWKWEKRNNIRNSHGCLGYNGNKLDGEIWKITSTLANWNGLSDFEISITLELDGTLARADVIFHISLQIGWQSWELLPETTNEHVLPTP